MKFIKNKLTLIFLFIILLTEIVMYQTYCTISLWVLYGLYKAADENLIS